MLSICDKIMDIRSKRVNQNCQRQRALVILRDTSDLYIVVIVVAFIAILCAK